MCAWKKPVRGAFAELTKQHSDKLQSLLSHSRSKASTAADVLETYNRDWMRQVHGNSRLLISPATTSEMASILAYCNEHRLAVCPQGGNTGLVFGSTPVHDEVIVSTARMNNAPEIHPTTMSTTTEAGVILQVLQQDAKAQGLLVPLDMGSKGSCFIGGALSTNAGGIHFARYGSMRSNCLGLEVVTPQGQILDLMSSLRKDNAGYDLKQLFVGSEGTLGIITKAEVKLFPYPKSSQVVLLHVSNFSEVLRTFSCATRTLSECLSAFEVMDAESLLCSGLADYPFEHIKGSFTILVETHGADHEHDFAKLGNFVQACEDEKINVLAQVLSQSEQQTRKLWSLREELPVKLAQAGTIYKFDVSFPLPQFYDVVEHIRGVARNGSGKFQLPEDEVAIVGYGHFGDGNVHLNIIDRTRGKHTADLKEILYPGAYEFTAKARRGSVSAEHGIGLQKKEYMSLSRSPEVIEVMRQLKKMMDPNGILNPYKVL
ncbi:D-lactate dehydrogenase 2 mitochondrial precursor, putative [Bodo saltans]|uniref:D-lactate dehydrogenase 2 mitochondrial, putative n=1 Tax=Bodo saltans TaxID=75058 RepID=A0A0S4IT80_BODSA|nr:D-lactate dehydrogenase 2 mitochondrial precursor, putative [Bodo saltans]|eukprot:CUE73730.1 D-lactate dehydrogenase 2 mitochondrial precursor, putative [Bodo saltans]